MKPILQWQPKEYDVVLELVEVLQASLDINRALQAAYPLLCKLVPVDHGAMCISRNDDPTRYDWAVAAMPQSFFRDYAEVAQHDFVRHAVSQKPNIVLCDSDMLKPEERAHVDRHPMVQYSRLNDMRIEQIMAVMFARDPSWNGGLTLYRDKRRAFSERERLILQRLTPYFTSAMANSKRYGEALRWSAVMENALALYGTTILVLSTSMEWIYATKGVEDVFDRCFGKGKRGPDGLPHLLSAELQRLPSGIQLVAPPLPWISPVSGAGVVVTFLPVVKQFGTYWMVLIDEVPQEWRDKLTRKEIDVAVRVAQGWDNALVAENIRNRESTTRTQLTSIFRKLGIEDRQTLTLRFKFRR